MTDLNMLLCSFREMSVYEIADGPVAVVPVSVEGSPPAAVAAVAAARAVAVPPAAPLVGRPRPPILELPLGEINIRATPRGEDLGDPSG